MFFGVLFSVVLGQPQLCSQPVQYSECAMKAHLSSANCSTVIAESSKKLYTCLCESSRQLLNCYAICLDDPALQLQKVVQERNVESTCKAAAEMRDEVSVLAFTSTTSTTSTAASSSTTVSKEKTSGNRNTLVGPKETGVVNANPFENNSLRVRPVKLLHLILI